ncbi:Gfo/Idh/MocA family protein [Streptomyces endophyticus]|uniref:Gfo/Idh/MocA family oxidoreductase n=1 Tax=Streptomyces endophyticus TaxID=714166 RepID=A0ABU6F076_9ACTN|nr:Gfo/Idh/MocA family oxidoreductase [Streptomyces endophyticus]MEB8337364.1 Gfo/Idh/MocA family oxidoreductase [Streptomyces endophyticus]
MTRKTVRIAMNGVTGRMGYRQHLVRSILALREQGGLDLGDGTVLWPEPVLVGRREHALKALAEKHDLDPANISTDIDAVLADDSIDIFFDAAMTSGREEILKKAIAAGKHIYTEKPTATGLEGAIELARLARAAGVKSGVVQDKLFLPGLLKLKRLIDGGFFGRILSVRGEFGYWVFEGDWQEAQRPSWNYRSEDGGGIVVDMFPHWEYVLHGLFGRVTSVNALAATHVPTRWDENGKPYEATADDSAYGIFQIEGGIVAQINSSWDVRVNRDELVEFQVDGTEGSAVAGLRNCRVQHRSSTPKPVWNPDLPATYSFRDQWQEVPDNTEFDNGFKVQWELFLQHVYAGADYHWDLLAGARGVQMAELGLKSSAEGRRFDVPEISL